MNKTFKSVWNESSGTYVAASEDTTASGRKTGSSRAARKMPRRGGSQRLVLEPRIVFDGALPVVAADMVETRTADTASTDTSAVAPATTNTPSESTLPPAESAQQERELIDGTFALAGQDSNEVIFIDSAVEGLQNFLLDHSQADVVLLDAGSDGMEQIAAVLEGRTGIEAIHILSHGSSGELNLGNDTFNLESMNGEHADELATIKSALSAEADILIYGCDVGAEKSGQAFISALSEATGADIAASTDLTGAAELGGDWDLESKTGTLETDSFALEGFAGVLLDPIVDLNSDPTVTVTGPVVTVTSATTDLVTNGDFGTVNGPVPPAPWVEAGAGSGTAAVVNGDDRYRLRDDAVTFSQALTVPTDTSNTTVTSSSTATTTTDVSTTVATTNEITSISFDFAWQNIDITGADDNQVRVSYNGVLYATFDTIRGVAGEQNVAGLVGNWNYFNGASGPATTLSVVNEITDPMTSITINLPTGVTASASLSFFYTAGSSGSGTDDVAFDNVSVNNTTTTTTSVTTTVTTADTADNDWTATFTENGPAVSIADIDSSIFDGDSANMASAAITLTNQTTGDRLLVNGSSAASGTLASGIAWTRTDTSVSLSGVFTKAQYADAIELVQFENTTENPSTTPRIINVTVNDGTVDSNVAVATINVAAVDDAPVEDRLPIEPEWFLNTDAINNEIFKWQIANDPTSPVLSAIYDIRKETALNSGSGVFQTDSITKAELTAGSVSDNAAPTYVQNSVRHLDLEKSSASISQTVKSSQLESTAKNIRAVSADNTAIPAVSNIVDSFAEKGFKQPNHEEDTDANTDIKPILTEKQLNKESEENKKSQSNTEDSKIKTGYTVSSDPNTKLEQEDGTGNRDNSETNIIKEKVAKSFSNQLQHMATNTRAPSNDIPSNK